LGTTNSAVAVVIDGRPVLVPDEHGRRTTPSVVHFAVDGGVLVGYGAQKRLTTDPRNTFHSVKRFMGKRFKDKKVAEDRRRVPYEGAGLSQSRHTVCRLSRVITHTRGPKD
jgi:molecular chaperone DnaK